MDRACGGNNEKRCLLHRRLVRRLVGHSEQIFVYDIEIGKIILADGDIVALSAADIVIGILDSEDLHGAGDRFHVDVLGTLRDAGADVLGQVEGIAGTEILNGRTVFGGNLGLRTAHVIGLSELIHRDRNDVAGNTDHDACIGIRVDIDISLECTDEERGTVRNEILAEDDADRDSLLAEALESFDADLIDTGTQDLALAGILHELLTEELHHAEILVLGDILIFADKTTGLVFMTAAETDIFGDVLGQLAGLRLFDTASDRELITRVGFVKGDTDVDAVDLDQEVTDETENIRITGLDLDKCQTELTVKGKVIHGLRGDGEFAERKVRVRKTDDGGLVKSKRVSHITIERVVDLGELVRIAVKPVVERGSADRIFVDVDAFVTEELPYERTAGADIRLDVGIVYVDTAELVVVDDRDLRGREETHITGTVLAVGGDEKIAGTEIGNTVFDRDTEHLDHHGEIDLRDLRAAAVNQTHVTAMALEIAIKRKA